MNLLRDSAMWLGWVILSPEEAFDSYIAERRSAILPILVFSIISYSIGSLMVKSVSTWILLTPLRPLLGPVSYVTGVAILGISLLSLVAYTAFVHLVVRLMGHHEGRWESYIGIVGFSSLPYLIPTSVMAIATLAGSIWTFVIGITLVLLSFAWSVYLVIIATAVNYGMDKGKAFIASVVSVILVVLALSLLRPWG